MSNFVFEIFSEELPATLQKKIAMDYKQFADKELKELGVKVIRENISVGITLNRLILIGKSIIISKEQLSNFIDKVLKDFSKYFPRTMCYPQLDVRWIRPIRGLFACIDNGVLNGEYYGVKLQNGTYINKFDFVECKTFDEYFDILQKEQIEINYDKRLEFVKKEIYNFNMRVIITNIEKNNRDYELYWQYNNTIKLAEEIAGMSEYCIKPMVGTLDERFYILPFELIELVLRENQRYVVFGTPKKENLIEFEKIQFLIFGDKITTDNDKRDNVLNGHKKVVNARLDDALYYWQLDKKEQEKCGGVGKYKEYLKQVLLKRIFIDNITWGDYLTKQEKFAEKIIKNKDILEKTKQLIWNTKLDLASGVVAEFPELQGVIGNYYFNYQEICRDDKQANKLTFVINPYILDKYKIHCYEKGKGCINDFTPIAYFYLIDRIVYIQTMFQQGKQPTGSGDKYKVKARMDDIVEIIYGSVIEKKDEILHEMCIINKDNETYNFDDNILKLYKKRYEKWLEEYLAGRFNKTCVDGATEKINFDTAKIKPFCEICIKQMANGVFYQDIKKWVLFFDELKDGKIYKRIHGYVKDIEFEENEEIIKKAKKVMVDNKDFENCEKYLDSHQIEGDNLSKKALKWIEEKYFISQLPIEFLEIL